MLARVRLTTGLAEPADIVERFNTRGELHKNLDDQMEVMQSQAKRLTGMRDNLEKQLQTVRLSGQVSKEPDREAMERLGTERTGCTGGLRPHLCHLPAPSNSRAWPFRSACSYSCPLPTARAEEELRRKLNYLRDEASRVDRVLLGMRQNLGVLLDKLRAGSSEDQISDAEPSAPVGHGRTKLGNELKAMVEELRAFIFTMYNDSSVSSTVSGRWRRAWGADGRARGPPHEAPLVHWLPPAAAALLPLLPRHVAPIGPPRRGACHAGTGPAGEDGGAGAGQPEQCPRAPALCGGHSASVWRHGRLRRRAVGRRSGGGSGGRVAEPDRDAVEGRAARPGRRRVRRFAAHPERENAQVAVPGRPGARGGGGRRCASGAGRATWPARSPH